MKVTLLSMEGRARPHCCYVGNKRGVFILSYSISYMSLSDLNLTAV